MVMRRLEIGSRSQAPSPAPAAEEFEFAAQGLQSDLVLHSFNVTNLINFNQTLSLVLKMRDQIIRDGGCTEDQAPRECKRDESDATGSTYFR
jgi:hypothetical protein